MIILHGALIDSFCQHLILISQIEISSLNFLKTSFIYFSNISSLFVVSVSFRSYFSICFGIFSCQQIYSPNCLPLAFHIQLRVKHQEGDWKLCIVGKGVFPQWWDPFEDDEVTRGHFYRGTPYVSKCFISVLFSFSREESSAFSLKRDEGTSCLAIVILRAGGRGKRKF